MKITETAEFRVWEKEVPKSLRSDGMWTFNVYRAALFMFDLAAGDVRDARVRGARPHASDQLLRAIGSISANVAEGFGRSSAADRSRFFGIALGSLRESFTWYRALEPELPAGVSDARYEQLSQLRQLLIGAQKWLAAKSPGSRLI